MNKLKLLITTLAVAILPLFAASPALAWSPLSNINCHSGGSGSSAVCQDARNAKNPLVGNDGVLIKIANIIAIIAGMVAVIIIVLAGIRLITSGGASEDVVGARRSIVYAAVGIIVIALARTLIVFVIGKL